MKYNFLWAKHLPNPILHAHSLSTQSRCHCHGLLPHHLGDHHQHMSTMTHQNLCDPVRHWTLTLTLGAYRYN